MTTVAEQIPKKAELAVNGYSPDALRGISDLTSTLPKDAESDVNVDSLNNDWSVKTSRSANALMEKATALVIGSGSDVDAISRMKMTGDLLSSYHADLWTAEVAIKTAITTIRVSAGIISSVSILGNKADLRGITDPLWEWVMAVPMPVFAKIITYVGLLAFYFGVALPSLPYTMFMIAVVGWILSVLQTTIAAPLWAIMHMRPSQTFVGSEAQGYLLLMALFVRPALAVIGLFAAMLIADPVVDFIAKAFFAMRGSVAASTGWVGVVAQFTQFFWWFSVFGGLLLPVLFMVFGLPQALPDRVLAWLNVGVHDLGATSAGSQMQGSLQGSANAAQRESVEKLSKKSGGSGSGARGPSGPSGSPGGEGGSSGSQGGAQPVNANHQGVAPSSAGSSGQAAPSGPRRGMIGTALEAGARGQFGTRLAEGLGVAIGRAVTDSAHAVKDAAAGGAEGFAGRLGSNMKDALVSAGSEGAAAFKEGADSRIAHAKAGGIADKQL